MKHWQTDATIESDRRYSWLVKFCAVRGWYWLASLAKKAGL